jgi:hypothetical protein
MTGVGLATLAIALLGYSPRAQTATGDIVGRVVAEDGWIVPGEEITAVGGPTMRTWTLSAGGNGEFDLKVPVGSYSIAFFSPPAWADVRGVVVTQGERIDLGTVVLRVGKFGSETPLQFETSEGMFVLALLNRGCQPSGVCVGEFSWPTRETDFPPRVLLGDYDGASVVPVLDGDHPDAPPTALAVVPQFGDHGSPGVLTITGESVSALARNGTSVVIGKVWHRNGDPDVLARIRTLPRAGADFSRPIRVARAAIGDGSPDYIPDALPRGSITGRVVNHWGAAMTNATVYIASDQLRTPLTTATDSAGIFKVAGLPDGRYRMAATPVGFPPLRRNIVISRGSTAAFRALVLPDEPTGDDVAKNDGTGTGRRMGLAPTEIPLTFATTSGNFSLAIDGGESHPDGAKLIDDVLAGLYDGGAIRPSDIRLNAPARAIHVTTRDGGSAPAGFIVRSEGVTNDVVQAWVGGKLQVFGHVWPPSEPDPLPDLLNHSFTQSAFIPPIRVVSARPSVATSAASSSSQPDTRSIGGTLTGTVASSELGNMRGLGVFAIEERSGRFYGGGTNEVGRFQFSNLPAGIYSVTFCFGGLRTQTVTDIEVKPGATTDIGTSLMGLEQPRRPSLEPPRADKVELDTSEGTLTIEVAGARLADLAAFEPNTLISAGLQFLLRVRARTFDGGSIHPTVDPNSTTLVMYPKDGTEWGSGNCYIVGDQIAGDARPVRDWPRRAAERSARRLGRDPTAPKTHSGIRAARGHHPGKSARRADDGRGRAGGLTRPASSHPFGRSPAVPKRRKLRTSEVAS